MTCEDADLLLAAYAVGGLEDDDTALLRRHLVDCRRCSAEGTRYIAAADLIPLGLDQQSPPPELRSRIMAQVHADAAARRPAQVSALRRLWQAIPTGRAVTLAGAVAVIAAVVIGVVAVRHAQSTSSLTAQACVNSAAPSTCGTLTWHPPAQQAVLEVTGLPQPAGTYELWLIGNGSTVPAAFLTRQPDGRTWSAAINADLGAYATVAATSEPAGGSPGPTGPIVFSIGVPRSS